MRENLILLVAPNWSYRCTGENKSTSTISNCWSLADQGVRLSDISHLVHSGELFFTTNYPTKNQFYDRKSFLIQTFSSANNRQLA